MASNISQLATATSNDEQDSKMQQVATLNSRLFCNLKAKQKVQLKLIHKQANHTKSLKHQEKKLFHSSDIVNFFVLLTCYLISYALLPQASQAISIKPADFDRLIMPCYLGSSSAVNPSNFYSSSQQQQLQQPPIPAPSSFASSSGQAAFSGYQSVGQTFGRSQASQVGGPSGGSAMQANQASLYPPPEAGRPGQSRDGLSTLGQQIARANTMDNFIALVSKLEAANPRLANNPDQLIRMLLGRFRLDNYYYDVRARTAISELDRRATDIQPALLNPTGEFGLQQQSQAQQQPQYIYSTPADNFPEHLLEPDEKCSLYFMLSHFIDKTSPQSPTLASSPALQLSGPAAGQRPPSLQAAGAGYPAQSGASAFNGAGRYAGPSPSFGSPATSNMNAFGAGINNQPELTGSNPYGMNVVQSNPSAQYNYGQMRASGQSSLTQAAAMSNRYSPPIVDGGQSRAQQRDERQALEFGVVALADQDNAAIQLNRVLMGILAASARPQTIRTLAAAVYPNHPLQTNTPKLDDELDPLYALTLADLWAVSSILKPDKPLDLRLLGNNGHWNDSMCPTSFRLERAGSIRFTTAELLGGLDGFNLGMLRRRMAGLRRNIRLSELLKMYYSKAGFRPQFAEVSVCNRALAINSQLDDLHRQAENYLRLYLISTPTSDNDLANKINRLDAFKDFARQAAQQYAPQELCQDSSYNDIYPMSSQDQCEIAKADLIVVTDSSPQANQPFMSLAVTKLAQRLGLSREGSTLSVLTNQQDSSGYGGAYSFNALIRNSSNLAEIGCALTHDTSQSYQGSQVSEPARLMEMFERALINLDSEYLVRQSIGSYSSSSSGSNGLFSSSSWSSSSYSRPTTSYISSLFQSTDQLYGLAPKNTAGAKVVVWFNYGAQQRFNSIASGPTSWNGPNYNSDNQYKFHEAKRYLKENFRGAVILAVGVNREAVKPFVYDEERDIFTDIPQGDSSSANIANPNDYPSYPAGADPASMFALAGQADQLVAKLLQRMCDVPAVFQYPMCFRGPSDNTPAAGYISPGRKQYWMMAPKSFHASRSIRMAFKVDGGRLRVCFGRRPRPDETAARSGQLQQQQQSSYQQPMMSLSQSNQNQPPGSGQQQLVSTQSSVVSASSSDYYTGLEYGICKDVAPGQEIDFIVSDPCYKKSIADCEPFYFVIKEISNQGEGDPNYMCRDEGCRRFDQAKFVMSHTGISCNSSLKAVQANWFLIVISVALSWFFRFKQN